MISRFLTLGKIPELRLEPQSPDLDKPAPEIELALEIEAYWDLHQLIGELRYESESGGSTKTTWKRIRKIVMPSIVTERDRNWFIKQGA